ncbi:DUF4878 domain-containing protein [Clostridiaceae bacterium M8S5]|nr:DUF4878 domain-containing protein [Clostridiaceae bacterium M8S5]
MKKIKLLSILCVLFIVLCGCSSGTKTDSPKGTVTSFFDLVKEGKYNDLDKVVDNAKDYNLGGEDNLGLGKDDQNKATADLLIKAMGNVKVDIKDEKIDGDKATVNVGVDYPNVGKAFQESMQELILKSMGKEAPDEEAMAKEFLDAMKKKLEDDIETLHNDVTINLIKKDGKWLITLDNDIANVITGNIYSIVQQFMNMAK